jgi:sirohydrochlorin cobaltochelatase
MSAPAVVLCGHGTRHADGAAEFDAVAAQVKALLPELAISHGFLELSEPLLSEALQDAVDRGHRRIIVIPCMLFAAGHAKTDIPRLLDAFERTHPGVEIVYGKVLGPDPALLAAAADRLRQVLPAGDLTDAHLLVIGRGSSDPDANSELARIMRLLWEGLGFGWGSVGYFDVTFPHLEPALDHAARLGYRRLVVFPYLLFTGVLVRRLREALAEARRRYPALDIIEAPYLQDHPGVAATFAARVRDALDGDTAMNCRLCRWRTPILAFGADHGHDHDHDDHDDHHHDHDDHDHDHGHHPPQDHHHHGPGHGPGHPFADHPAGPQGGTRWR